MIKRKKRERPPKRNWLPMSIILIVLSVLVTFLYIDVLYRGDLYSFLLLVYLLAIWFFDFLYVLTNTLRERPGFELKKSFEKIKKIEIYESWYFLLSIGLFFGLVVIGSFVNFGQTVGCALLVLLFGFWLAWIKDILKGKRDRS